MAEKRIIEINGTATSANLTDNDYIAVDHQDNGTRRTKLSELATWIHNKWAAFVNALTAKTSFASGDKIPVVNGSTATAMDKDTLLSLTAQNALADNVAPAFVPNSTTTVADQPYIYDGLLYVAKEAYQGPWDASKFDQKPVSEIFLPGSDVQDAVDNWLEEHPEATTTVEDNSITDAKLVPGLKFNRNADYSKYGYCLLSKDSSLLSQMTSSDTVYEVRWDFDLDGDTLNIPSNSILKFNGGKIYNGTIVGNNTRIDYSGSNCFGNDIIVLGTWDVSYISSDIIENYGSNNAVKKLVDFTNGETHSVIELKPYSGGEVIWNPSTNDDKGIVLKSNTKLIVDCELRVGTNGYPNYALIDINSCKNIEITGKGYIAGDKNTHDYETIVSTHEWGHCIFCHGVDNSHNILNSNVNIHDIVVKDATGDAIYLDCIGSNIYNMRIFNCGRGGISYIHVDGAKAWNCKITDITGALPRCAIGIEPNDRDAPLRNIEISNIEIARCYGMDFLYCDNVKVSNVTAYDCEAFIALTNCNDISFEYLNYSGQITGQGVTLLGPATQSNRITISNSFLNPSNSCELNPSRWTLGYGLVTGSNVVMIPSNPANGSVRFSSNKLQFFFDGDWVYTDGTTQGPVTRQGNQTISGNKTFMGKLEKGDGSSDEVISVLSSSGTIQLSGENNIRGLFASAHGTGIGKFFVYVDSNNNAYLIGRADTAKTAPALASASSDGTYSLKAIKTGDTITYSWVVDAS